jgi:sugar phosphate isomerase/epimerase
MAELSAFADEVSDDFSQQVRFLVAEKIGHIEIRFVNRKNVMDLSDTELREVKQMLADHGLGVSAIGSPIGKVKIDEPFTPHLDRFKHAIELAAFFEAPFIRVFSYYPPEGQRVEDHRSEVLERMGRQVELLENTDAVMVHENETGIYGSSAESCVDIVSSIDSPKLRLAYDPGNFVWGQKIANNVETCWPLMRPYVAHVHIKDWKLGGEKVGAMPGEGDGQIRELLAALAEMDYRGFLTMEPHLKSGGQFGGETGPELFSAAVGATRALCADVGLTCN